MRGRVDVRPLLDLAREFPRHADAIIRDLGIAVERAAAFGVSAIRQGAPVFTGELANSVVSSGPAFLSAGGAVVVRDEILVGAPHGLVVEEGRAAGSRRPPFGPILRWVELKHRRGHLGDLRWTGKEGRAAERAAAFVLVRSIAERGIDPQRFAAKEIPAIEAVLEAEVERLSAEWAARVNRGA